MTVPLGVVSRTGIAGLTLGGGVGWLARQLRPGLRQRDLVRAGDRGRRGPARERQRESRISSGRCAAAAGNFGVVTSFEYRLCPVATVLGGLVIHPRDRATDLLRFYRSFTQSAPDELAAYAALLHTPDGRSGRGRRGLLQRRPRRGRTGAGAAARLRLADGRSRSADADAGHADDLRRGGAGRQPELLEVGIPARVERRGDRDDRRARQPGDSPTDRGAHRAVRRRRQPRRDRRHGVRASATRSTTSAS